MERRSRQDTAERFDRLTRELTEERASALKRISGTLESLIDQMQAVRARLELLDEAERPAELAAYAELRRKALTYR
jgi:hypothetical protein